MEREHEREDFQQEIQRLEEQLRQMARPQPRSAPDSNVSQQLCPTWHPGASRCWSCSHCSVLSLPCPWDPQQTQLGQEVGRMLPSPHPLASA